MRKIGKIFETNELVDRAKQLAKEDAAEVVKLYFEGKTFQEAMEIVKSYYPTDQSKDNSQEIDINDIIAPGENIDNGQVYSEVTGETLRDLRGI